MSTDPQPALPPQVEAGIYLRAAHQVMREKARAAALAELGDIEKAYALAYQAIALGARQGDGKISHLTLDSDRRGAIIAAFVVGLRLVEDAILEGFNVQASALVRQELEAIAALEEIQHGRRMEKKTPNSSMVSTLNGRIYGDLSNAAHLGHHATLRSLVGTAAEFADAPGPVSANLMSPQHIPESTRRLFGLHVLLMLHLVEHQEMQLQDLHGIALADEAAEASHQSLQLLAQAGVVIVG